jgi:hypothetical protein
MSDDPHFNFFFFFASSLLSLLLLTFAQYSYTQQLEIPDMQKVVNSANQLAEENAKRAAALFALHEAVRSGDSARTLGALKDPFVGVTGVNDVCKDRYQDALSIAVKNKVSPRSLLVLCALFKLRNGLL